MAIVGGDEQIALLARQASNWGDIGIDQRAQHLREHRFGRALLARDHQEGIGPATRPKAKP
jgi:hypothetical protein